MWPVLLRIPLPFGGGEIPLRSFGVMVVLAFVAGTAVMQRLAKRDDLAEREDLDRLFFALLAAIVLGARALYVVTNLHEFRGRWFDVVRIDKGGMAMYGSLLACVGVALTFFKRRRLPVWALADAGAVAGALGIGIGRIGCLLVGDDYGKPVSAGFPLGIKFPTRTEPGSLYGLAISPNNGNLIPADHQGVWLHPTQIYMSVNGFVLAAILYALYRRKAFHGQVFAAFIVLKGLTRSAIEIVRDDDDRGFVGPLSTSQFIGLATAVMAAVLWVVLRRRAELRVAPAAPREPAPPATAAR